MTRKNIKVKLNRKHLIRLLKRWQRGEVVEREVHETAKALWDNIGEFLEPIKNRSVYVREWPEYSKDDDRSIIIEIINKLAWLDDECLTKKDIPYMLEFLSTPAGKAKEGWKKWRKYYWVEVKLNREALIRLLKRWQRGEVDEREVHETGEVLSDNIGEILEPIKNRSIYVWEWPEYSEDDDRSILIEVVNKLDFLNAELVIKEDIPAMLGFLSTAAGKSREGWKKWKKYWDSVDLKKRAQELESHPYYYATDIYNPP